MLSKGLLVWARTKGCVMEHNTYKDVFANSEMLEREIVYSAKHFCLEIAVFTKWLLIFWENQIVIMKIQDYFLFII